MTGKKIFITGASSGIGLETAVQFAKQNIGNHLVLGARRLSKLEDLANKLQDSHKVECSVFNLDVRDTQNCLQFIEKGAEIAGGIDVLINNAGLSLTLDHVLNQREEDVKTMFETNVFGLLAITKLALPLMLKQNYGHIINIGSVAGYIPYEGGSAYCASKFAVRAITESLRLELLGKNIRVTNISPGMTETEFSLVRFWEIKKKQKKYMTDGYFLPKDGYFLPKDGYFLPKDGYFLSKDGYFLSKDGYFLPKDGYFLPKDGYFLPKDGYFLPKDGYFLSKDGYFLSKDGYFLPKDGYFLPKDGYFLPKDGYFLPKDGYFLPKDGYFLPKDGYFLSKDGRVVLREKWNSLILKDTAKTRLTCHLASLSCSFLQILYPDESDTHSLWHECLLK
ncbi:hypothetical protein CHS0354_023904 [Potamilus streckersoni]|uniref:Uncharacterized protein n=1 Tax=Potamilus streckersoni TaxID=2493646 RepID=A0AAE0VMP8_9BIVA|nr:hypothetical protein CHS0354_023904 [Potamilus streckersoni]